MEPFWKKRTKHGRDKLFTTPEILWEACLEYFEYTEKRTWPKIEYKGNPPEKTVVNLRVPFTQRSLYIFLNIHHSTWLDYRDNHGEDFSAIVATVDDMIYNQKFDGAAVGAFSATLIARDLGLADRIETKSDTSIAFDLSGLSDSEKEMLFELSLKLKPGDK
jgi:hypothetical protein